MRVKFYSSTNIEHLESKVNVFFKENPDIDVKSCQYRTEVLPVDYVDTMEYSVCIVYSEAQG